MIAITLSSLESGLPVQTTRVLCGLSFLLIRGFLGSPVRAGRFPGGGNCPRRSSGLSAVSCVPWRVKVCESGESVEV